MNRFAAGGGGESCLAPSFGADGSYDHAVYFKITGQHGAGVNEVRSGAGDSTTATKLGALAGEDAPPQHRRNGAASALAGCSAMKILAGKTAIKSAPSPHAAALRVAGTSN